MYSFLVVVLLLLLLPRHFATLGHIDDTFLIRKECSNDDDGTKGVKLEEINNEEPLFVAVMRLSYTEDIKKLLPKIKPDVFTDS